MKIAVIGSGGREHAICWKLEQSSQVEKVFCIPGNAGTSNNVSLAVEDFAGIKDFCEANQVELIFVGPEQPLNTGIVDYFNDSSIMVFGPDKAASQLESSKVFAKEFMNKYGVRTAEYRTFNQTEAAMEYCRNSTGKCVIKYDGLAAGKGVFVCETQSEAEVALSIIKETYGNDARLLIEELLTGQELSILAFTDGSEYQILLPSQDHKQLLEGDMGPNTGGMGAFCPVEFCTPELMTQIMKEIIEPSIAGLKAENFNYHGVLYFGLMISPDGAKVLEYNVRMGDPETEVVLPALKSDFLELILACMQGGLADIELEFQEGFFVDVVLASGGYPQQYVKGYKIDIPLDVSGVIFHAGSKIDNEIIVTSGGRVLNVVANGKDLKTAISNVYNLVSQVQFKDMYYRTDIGTRNK
jgi:phosphoribosylamine---glycine ligase